MNENELMTDSAATTEDTYWPDGFQEGDDVFSPDTWSGNANSDESPADAAEDGGADGAADDGGDPTTGTEESDGRSVGDDAGSDSDGSDAADADSPFVFEAKVNHGAPTTVDLRNMSRDELQAMYQKAAAFDASKAKADKDRYQQIVEEEIGNGMSDRMAHIAAKAEVGADYSGEDDTNGNDDDNGSTATTTGRGRDFRAEIAEVREVYPDMKNIPDSVVQSAATTGHSLLREYAAYRQSEASKAAANLRKENKTLRQNADNAARSPVRGTTGSGKVKEVDPDVAAMLAGYDSNGW